MKNIFPHLLAIAKITPNIYIAFQNVSGAAKVTQENSYNGYGLMMPGSLVGFSSPPNKNLYNGGSEWQNDTKAVNAGVPDYYQTFYRNYDPALARFVSVDPEAEGAASMSDYHYAGDNPIMNNDPMGNLANVKINQPNPQGGFTDPSLEGSGEGYVDPVGSIGTNSDPNWMNDGAFDDVGAGINPKTNMPYNGLSFSSDNGVAGFQFWAKADMSGGVLDPSVIHDTYVPPAETHSNDPNPAPTPASVSGGATVYLAMDQSLGLEYYADYSDQYYYAGEFHLRVNGSHLIPPRTTANVQYLNTCFFKTLEWVTRYLGDQIDWNNSELFYVQRYQMNLVTAPQTGINPTQTATILNQFVNWFYTDSPDVVPSAIDAGNPIMSSIYVGQDPVTNEYITHAVFITGWNGDTSFTYVDPFFGTYNSSGFYNFHGFAIITGVKDHQ